MKDLSRKTRIKSLCIFLTMVLFFSFSLTAFAINGVDEIPNGAYVIKAKTTYTNPDTGKTASGGNDNPMGKIMCDKYVGKEMLLEKTDDKIYITFSMTGAKFLKNLKVEVVDKNGDFRTVPYKVTFKDNDKDLIHFRVEVREDDKYISPSFFVEIMKKQIQFFITPITEGKTEGNGNFKSEMVTEKEELPVFTEENNNKTETTNTEANSKVETTTKRENSNTTEISATEQSTTAENLQNIDDKISTDNENKDLQNSNEKEKSRTSTYIYVGIGILLLIAIIVATVVIFNKKKKD